MLKHEFSRFDFTTLTAALITYRDELTDGLREVDGTPRIEVLRERDRVNDLIRGFARAHTGWLHIEEDN